MIIAHTQIAPRFCLCSENAQIPIILSNKSSNAKTSVVALLAKQYYTKAFSRSSDLLHLFLIDTVRL
jgi:hypothetical protein